MNWTRSCRFPWTNALGRLSTSRPGGAFWGFLYGMRQNCELKVQCVLIENDTEVPGSIMIALFPHVGSDPLLLASIGT